VPVAMNFTSLQNDLRTYLERGGQLDDTVEAQLPSLINLAERNIATALKIQGFITVVNTNLVQSASIYVKPVRWRETISIHYGVDQTRTPIFPRSYEYCRYFWPDDTFVGVPKFYADYDYAHWLIVPTPMVNYNAEILYYEQPALLDASNSINWLTTYAPNVLLYRALFETAVFLKDNDRANGYQAQFNEALGQLNTQDLKRVVDRSTTRQEA
jgi:hypothetical protein